MSVSLISRSGKGLRRLTKAGANTIAAMVRAPKKGRPRLSAEMRNQKFAPLDALIREHWKTKDDWEIGRMMEPNVSGNGVLARRYELGLKKAPATKLNNTFGETIRGAIDAEEFERMVLREGYTMTEYAALKNLRCSRERLRQVAEQLGLKHSPEDRAPEWVLIRKARKVGQLDLANREWLAQKITHYQSITALAAELGIGDDDLFFFIRSFKLSHPSFRKHGAETMHLVCSKCGTEFTRLKRWVDQRLKKANGHPLEFFCTQSCSGQWNRERVRKRVEERSAKQLKRERTRMEKKERHAAYIRENWQAMSDAQLALALELSLQSITRKRLGLRLLRV